jgi:hypothetical protein
MQQSKWYRQQQVITVACAGRLFQVWQISNLWIDAVPAVRVFEDQALQIIPTVSHCTRTKEPDGDGKVQQMTSFVV